MGKWYRKGAMRQRSMAMEAFAHGCTRKVFFGNIDPAMPEAEFLEIVKKKVGAIATVKENPPAPSWGPKKPKLCNLYV